MFIQRLNSQAHFKNFQGYYKEISLLQYPLIFSELKFFQNLSLQVFNFFEKVNKINQFCELKKPANPKQIGLSKGVLGRPYRGIL